jgi:hypothetical protein
LVSLASARREIREERSAGERKSLRRSFYSTLFVRRGRIKWPRWTTEWLTPFTINFSLVSPWTQHIGAAARRASMK